MKKAAAVMILAAVFVLLFAASAIAGPTNPRRQEMLKSLKRHQELLKTRKVKSIKSVQEATPSVGIDLSGDLTSGETVTLTATVTGVEDPSGLKYIWAIQDVERDPSGYTYYGEETEEAQLAYTFYSAGHYACWVDVYQGENNIAWEYIDFTVGGTQTIEKKVAEVVSSCRASTDWQTALNLYDWLTHHMYYDGSYSFYGPDAILRGYGVCDSYSKDYLLLCQEAGIPVERALSSSHAWNTLNIDGKWYQADPTWDDPNSAMPGEGSPVSGWEGHEFFCLNSSIMQSVESHELKSGAHAASCTSLDANYYIYTEEWKNWGLSDYGPTGGFVTPVYTLVDDAFNQDITVWNLNEDTGYDGALWEMSGDEISWVSSSYNIKPRLLIWAISRDGVMLENGGPATVSASLTDDGFCFRLTGWNIPDPGTLDLPDDAETVEEQAFLGVDAAIVSFPSRLNTVGARAFADSSVRTVYFSGNDIDLASDAFDGCERLIFVTDNAAAIQYAADHGYLVIAP